MPWIYQDSRSRVVVAFTSFLEIGQWCKESWGGEWQMPASNFADNFDSRCSQHYNMAATRPDPDQAMVWPCGLGRRCSSNA